MFQFLSPTTVRLVNLTCRVEAAGKRKDVPAVTLRLKLEGVQNTMLDLISPTARATFYAPVEGQEELPGVEPSTPILRSKDIKHWNPEDIAFHGWSVTIDHGIDDTSAIVMTKAKIDGFAVALYEGGAIDMEFRVSTSDIDSEGVGILWASQKQQFPVTILAPEVPAAPIDGSVEAFRRDHPEFSEDQGDLLSPEDALAATEGGPEDDDADDEGSQPDASQADAQREQAELEAGMAASLAADGVKPKRGRAASKAH